MKTIVVAAIAAGFALTAPAMAAETSTTHHTKVVHHAHSTKHVSTTRRTHHTAHGTTHTVVHKEWTRFHANVRAPKRFHIAAAYVRPAGWRTHRWVFNEHLPRAYFASTYWLNDYASYDLMAPDEGLVWVRVGDDAVLVDRDSGLVVRVVYDEFE